MGYYPYGSTNINVNVAEVQSTAQQCRRTQDQMDVWIRQLHAEVHTMQGALQGDNADLFEGIFSLWGNSMQLMRDQLGSIAGNLDQIAQRAEELIAEQRRQQAMGNVYPGAL